MINDNISIKALAGIVAAVGVFAGAIVGIESRYFHRDEAKAQKAATEHEIEMLRLWGDLRSLNQRKETLEDYIYAAGARQTTAKMDTGQRAILERNQAELASVNANIVSKRAAIDTAKRVNQREE